MKKIVKFEFSIYAVTRYIRISGFSFLVENGGWEKSVLTRSSNCDHLLLIGHSCVWTEGRHGHSTRWMGWTTTSTRSSADEVCVSTPAFSCLVSDRNVLFCDAFIPATRSDQHP